MRLKDPEVTFRLLIAKSGLQAKGLPEARLRYHLSAGTGISGACKAWRRPHAARLACDPGTRSDTLLSCMPAPHVHSTTTAIVPDLHACCTGRPRPAALPARLPARERAAVPQARR